MSLKQPAICALKALQTRGPTSVADLVKLDPTIKKNTINNLRIGGYVRQDATAVKGKHNLKWFLTSTGVLASETTNKPPAKKQKAVIEKLQVAQPRVPLNDGDYTQPPSNVHRPGAMDAFRLPSLIGGTQKAYRNGTL